MPQARLKFEGGELELGGSVVTLGRASDNSVSFPDDDNVSRYHAEIEPRGEYYCLVDLGSSNGVTVNGQPVAGELYLWDGAEIALGGTSIVKVQFASNGEYIEEEQPFEAEPATSGTENVAAAEAAPAGSKKMLAASAGIFGLAVLFAAGAGAIYYTSGSGTCDARVEILSPEQGEAITDRTEIRIDVTNEGCVGRAIFAIDGIEFASSDEPPFEVSVDPDEFPEFADGYDYPLTVLLEDNERNRFTTSDPVLLAFETRAIAKPTPGDIVKNGGGQETRPADTRPSAVSLIDIHNMSKQLLSQFPASAGHSVSNRQLLIEIQKRTAEYAKDGYFNKAANYRDAINVAYVREQNLDAGLGFILAMSRSQFDPAAAGNELGIWRMSNEFVTENGYLGQCGTETLADPSQNCAANASALYLKSVIFGVFDGDPIYSVAAFGKSPQEAAAWNDGLPENRADIWNTVTGAAEREQIIRFFAAGIVAENPQKFGLTNDRPLSELYRLTL
jgi:pSer/pThr/pTyr-binding forkhead associated (FHA) protein